MNRIVAFCSIVLLSLFFVRCTEVIDLNPNGENQVVVKALLIILLLATLGLPVKAQGVLTEYSVKDSETMSAIADCAISYIDKNHKTHIITASADGVFRIDKEAVSVITISHIGYESKTLYLSQMKNNHIVLLKAKSVQLDSVVVYSSFSQTNKGNEYRYSPLQASSSISIIGEPDVLRHISSLPSVSQGVEGIGAICERWK